MTSLNIKQITPLILLVFVVRAGAAPLFEDNAVLEVWLSGSLATLIANKHDRKELPFVLRVHGSEHAVKVRVRGKSRLRVCDFPPLRINFANDDTQYTVFSGQDKLKLVTHCRKYARAEQDLLEEFAAYKIFSLISDFSYNVRLLRVTYRDTEEGQADESLERYGFVIESASELAMRLDAAPQDVTGVSLKSLNQEQLATVAVFEHLIGNTDWSLVIAEDDDSCCHNGDLFKFDSQLYYVPYDFDLAGLVDARYAYPDPSLGIRSVTQRRYRGYCTSREALQVALGKVKARKSEILQVIRELPGLSQKDMEVKVDYLNQYFVRIEDEDKLLRSYERQCI